MNVTTWGRASDRQRDALGNTVFLCVCVFGLENQMMFLNVLHSQWRKGLPEASLPPVCHVYFPPTQKCSLLSTIVYFIFIYFLRTRVPFYNPHNLFVSHLACIPVQITIIWNLILTCWDYQIQFPFRSSWLDVSVFDYSWLAFTLPTLPNVDWSYVFWGRNKFDFILFFNHFSPSLFFLAPTCMQRMKSSLSTQNHCCWKLGTGFKCALLRKG